MISTNHLNGKELIVIKYELGLRDEKPCFRIVMNDELKNNIVKVIGLNPLESDTLLEDIMRIPFGTSFPKMAKNQNEFKKAFYIANDILFKMTEQEQFVFGICIINSLMIVRSAIAELMEINTNGCIYSLCKDVRELITATNTEIGLVDKCKAYANTIKIAIDSNIGRAEHHTSELTWLPEHYRGYFGIIIMVKLLSPIVFSFLGEVGKKITMPQGYMPNNNRKIVSNLRKEYFALHMFLNLIEEYWTDILDKILFYIDNTIYRKQVKNNKDSNFDNTLTNMMNDVSPEQVTYVILATLLCKSFLKVDLFSGDYDIMSLTKNDVETYLNELENRGGNKRFKERIEIEQEESNSTKRSQLEVDSSTSRHLFDTDCIVRYLHEKLISKLKVDFKIDEERFKRAFDFNMDNIMEFPQFRVFLLSTIYGRSLNSAINITKLNRIEIIELITVTQFIAESYGYYEIICILSSNRRFHGDGYEEIEEQEKCIDTLRCLSTNCMEYQNIINRLSKNKSVNSMDKRFGQLTTMMKKLMDDMIDLFAVYKWYISVPHTFLPKLDEIFPSITNGKIYQPSINLIPSYCSMLTYQL